MRSVMIRHAAVNLKPKSSMTGDEFIAYLEEYEKAPIQTVTEQAHDIHHYHVYVSPSPRAGETAAELFKQKDWEVNPLIGEVPMRPYADGNFRRPLWYWIMRARIQWYFNNERQPETRKASYERAAKVMHLIQQSDRDTVLVTHGFFMLVFMSYCKQNRYEVTRYGGLRIAPLERVRITERDAHCGRCVHNCLLANPGCDIGKEMAAFNRPSA